MWTWKWGPGSSKLEWHLLPVFVCSGAWLGCIGTRGRREQRIISQSIFLSAAVSFIRISMVALSQRHLILRSIIDLVQAAVAPENQMRVGQCVGAVDRAFGHWWSPSRHVFLSVNFCLEHTYRFYFKMLAAILDIWGGNCPCLYVSLHFQNL